MIESPGCYTVLVRRDARCVVAYYNQGTFNIEEPTARCIACHVAPHIT